MFEAFAEKGRYPDYRTTLQQAGRKHSAHSWGRQTTA
jgi:hypothetical protein